MTKAVLSVNAQERMCHGKRRYPAEITALIAVQRYAARYGVAQRVYPCPVCGGFHITTQVANELKGPSRASANPVPPSMTGKA